MSFERALELWKFLTAGHIVYLRPCPAAGRIAAAFTNLISFAILQYAYAVYQICVWVPYVVTIKH